MYFLCSHIYWKYNMSRCLWPSTLARAGTWGETPFELNLLLAEAVRLEEPTVALEAHQMFDEFWCVVIIVCLCNPWQWFCIIWFTCFNTGSYKFYTSSDRSENLWYGSTPLSADLIRRVRRSQMGALLHTRGTSQVLPGRIELHRPTPNYWLLFFHCKKKTT